MEFSIEAFFDITYSSYLPMKNRIRYLIGTLPVFDRKITVITIISTLLLIFNSYFRITSSIYIDRLILYFFVPIIVITLFFRESPSRYGFQWGDWRAGLVITVMGILLIAPIIYFVVKIDPNMQDFFGSIYTGNILWIAFLDLFGWEFLFRGWILFGYEKEFGANALWLQAVPFALAHIGKPAVETVSTIFGGFAFGWVAWRTKSFLYPFLIHMFVTCFTILVASGSIK